MLMAKNDLQLVMTMEPPDVKPVIQEKIRPQSVEFTVKIRKRLLSPFARKDFKMNTIESNY